MTRFRRTSELHVVLERRGIASGKCVGIFKESNSHWNDCSLTLSVASRYFITTTLAFVDNHMARQLFGEFLLTGQSSDRAMKRFIYGVIWRNSCSNALQTVYSE
jgi:hypothetical protein